MITAKQERIPQNRGFLTSSAELIGSIKQCSDLTSVAAGAFIAHYLRLESLTLNTTYQYALLTTCLAVFIIFRMFGLYRPWSNLSVWLEIKALLLAWASVVIMGLVVAYFTKTGAHFSRLWLSYWMIATGGLLVCSRLAMRYALKWVRSRGMNNQNVLIVGAQDLGRKISLHLKENYWAGLNVVGFLDNDPKLHGDVINGVKVLGGLENLERLALQKQQSSNFYEDKVLSQVSQIWIALPVDQEKDIQGICKMLENSALSVVFVPDVFSLRLFNYSVDNLAGLPIVNLRAAPITGKNLLLKTTMDYMISLVALILLSPIMAIIAVIIKLESEGPVIFKQRRYGVDGKEIIVWKFRTMGVTQDGNHIQQATVNDPRITRFGGFLRKTSLDELPQFINVLQGTMSVVGPRPHAVAHNELYRKKIAHYMWRHKAKPGITGFAQINGWRGETDTREKMEKRVEYDLEYLQRWSLWLDIQIIFKTIISGFANKNAR